MTRDEIQYCLAKQLESMNAIHSNYGYFELDPDMHDAVEQALRPLLEKRLREGDFEDD